MIFQIMKMLILVTNILKIYLFIIITLSKLTVLKEGMVDAGIHQAIWDGKNDNGVHVGSGVYLYQFKANKYSKMGKMLLIR